ncbi:MAG: glycosyltransferase family 2 protein [Verrucomicrobia bacterium]|nr:glycosyltransferase family 2 protein [Verrucomicrobiota bacterium]
MDWPRQCAVVIPCFNEAACIGRVVGEVRAFLPAMIVVDDGSADETGKFAAESGAEVVRHERNLGKGAALASGLRRARERGFAWALTMDGDGQHAPEDIPKLLAKADTSEAALLIGDRMHAASQMPWLRRVVNRWMSRRLSARAGVELPDTQCGFRLMRLDAWSALRLETTHFETESETLLAFLRAGHAVEFVPVQVIYKREQSKIHPLRDAWRWLRWWGQAK